MTSSLETMFLFQATAYKIPLQPEYKFHPTRRWRFDFCIPEKMLAIEVEGGAWMAKSRHTSGLGFAADCIKYSEAAILGWRIIRVTGEQVKNGMAIDFLRRAIE